MTNTITNYNDLLQEKERLTALLKLQHEAIKQDIRDIKQEFAPVRTAVSMLGKFTTKDRSNLGLTFAADKIIDLLVRRLLLNKAGWFTKLVVPFVMKNFSSHVIADNKDKIFSTIKSFFSRKKDSQEPEPEGVFPVDPMTETEED